VYILKMVKVVDIDKNEPLRAKGLLLVGEEVRKDDVGKVGS
jgi:hypothetical protein